MPPSNNQNPERYRRRQCKRGKHRLFNGSLVIEGQEVQLCSRRNGHYHELGICELCGEGILGKRLGRLDNPNAEYRKPRYVPFMIEEGCISTLNKCCYVEVPNEVLGAKKKTKFVSRGVEEDSRLKELVVPALKDLELI
tara:strand:+ start:339 stop:755 length:417 start_codon:yes stop_codon:yes gene_type:complete